MTVLEFVLGNLAIMLPLLVFLVLSNQKIKKEIMCLKIYMIQVLKKLRIPFIEDRT